MSDRLDEIKEFIVRANALANASGTLKYAIENIEWGISEIDRLRANQIPGRCGECAERRVGRNSFGQYSYCMWKNGEFDPDGYCDEWKPKEKRDA